MRMDNPRSLLMRSSSARMDTRSSEQSVTTNSGPSANTSHEDVRSISTPEVEIVREQWGTWEPTGHWENQDYNDLLRNSGNQNIFENLKELVDQMKTELNQVKAAQQRQESAMEAHHQSILSNFNNIKNWGDSIAQENAYLRSEIQRITNDYNSLWYTHNDSLAEMSNLQARLDAHKTKARQIGHKVQVLVNGVNNQISSQLAEILELCPES